MRFFRPAALLALVLFCIVVAGSRSGGSGASAGKVGASSKATKKVGYVILNTWDANLIPKLRRQRPGVKILAYKNLSLTVASACVNGIDDAHVPAGAGYCDANAHHPDWFLVDKAGKRVNSNWFPNAWMMDVGNPAYQQHWLDQVSTELKGKGWDGVYVDDADADPNWHLEGRVLAKYPSIKSWQVAMRSMLAKVGPGFMSQGLLFIPNLSTPWSPQYNALSVWKDWLQFTSGASQEYFTKWGASSSSWFTGADWTFRQQFQRSTEAAHKIFLGITYAPPGDTHSLMYARSNFLLNTTGGPSALLFHTGGNNNVGDPTVKSWTSPIGKPSTKRLRLKSGVWVRSFTGGFVAVNPTTRSHHVLLGHVFLNSSSHRVSAVTLRPASGAIFRSVR